MTIRKLTPNLMVEDVRATVDFYGDILGFDLVMAVPESQDGILTELSGTETIVYALVRNGSSELMFQSQKSMGEDIPVLAGKSVGASVSLYLETNGINEICDRIRPKVQIVKDLFTTWYGMKEFYFLDNNNYVLCLAEQVTMKES